MVELTQENTEKRGDDGSRAAYRGAVLFPKLGREDEAQCHLSTPQSETSID